MTPLDVLTDLFGSDPIDLHGAMIVDAGGLAQLVSSASPRLGF